jgi:hypothetical protein
MGETPFQSDEFQDAAIEGNLRLPINADFRANIETPPQSIPNPLPEVNGFVGGLVRRPHHRLPGTFRYFSRHSGAGFHQQHRRSGERRDDNGNGEGDLNGIHGDANTGKPV